MTPDESVAPEARTAKPGNAPPAPPTPRRPPALYVGRLDSLGAVRREAARHYPAARRGALDPQDASRLASVLALIARLIEGSDLERRVAALEAAREPWHGG